MPQYLRPEDGLSPRVRGNRRRYPYGHDRERSIPACAGEPWTGSMAPARCPVYPRVCGGTHPGVSQYAAYHGLSPRVRGNPQGRPGELFISRSIPACAGEPAALSPAGWRRRVYPRVCGGTARSARTVGMHDGLSPRVRGNHSSVSASAFKIRSIPACAGEPPHRCNRPRSSRVYPRVCGGTPPSLSSPSPRGGLSPRVRGNLDPGLGVVGVKRSIPACAGEPGAP